MKRSGVTNFVTLAIGASHTPTIQLGDVVQCGASRRALIATLEPGAVRGWPIIPQTSPRHRGELRLSAEHVATLGLPRNQRWLIRCTATELVAPVAVLGRLCDAVSQDVQRTARRAAVSDAMELRPMAGSSKRPPRARRVWADGGL